MRGSPPASAIALYRPSCVNRRVTPAACPLLGSSGSRYRSAEDLTTDTVAPAELTPDTRAFSVAKVSWRGPPVTRREPGARPICQAFHRSPFHPVNRMRFPSIIVGTLAPNPAARNACPAPVGIGSPPSTGSANHSHSSAFWVSGWLAPTEISQRLSGVHTTWRVSLYFVRLHAANSRAGPPSEGIN